MEGKVKHKIGWVFTAIFGYITLILDIITIVIPGAGDVIGPIYWPIMALIFWMKGLGFLNGKRLAAGSISLVAELIPAVQALPTLFAGFLFIVFTTRIEEKTGISITSMMSGKKPGVTLPRGQKMPLNSKPGVRLPNK